MPQISIGAILVVFMIIYILFHILSFLTEETVAVTEVKQGSIVSDHSFTALAVRQEQLYSATDDGYIFFYAKNNIRAGVKTKLYGIDKDGSLVRQLNSAADSSQGSLTDEEKSQIEDEIVAFSSNFNTNTYSSVYSFSDTLGEDVSSAFSQSAVREFKSEIKQAKSNKTFHNYYAPQPGLVVFSMDGMEDVTVSNFTKSSFDSSKLKYTNLRQLDQVYSGQTVYKLITSDDWNLIVPVSEAIYKKEKDESAVKIRFTEDDVETYVTSEAKKKDGSYYLILSLDDSMERYADERYIDIDLIMDQVSGLKVPNSSIAVKNLYEIPNDYITRGNDSDNKGVLVQDDKGKTSFEQITVYESDEDNDSVWIDPDDLSSDSVIVKPDSSETYTVGTSTKKVSGVYIVNKGYAEFEMIKTLYKNSQYSIVEPLNNGTVRLYDRIALVADDVHEGQIINNGTQ